MHVSRNWNHGVNTEAIEINFNHWDEYLKSSENSNRKADQSLLEKVLSACYDINVYELDKLKYIVSRMI